jgi:hypothetical protein
MKRTPTRQNMMATTSVLLTFCPKTKIAKTVANGPHKKKPFKKKWKSSSMIQRKKPKQSGNCCFFFGGGGGIFF